MTPQTLLQLLKEFPLPFEVHGKPTDEKIRAVVFDSRQVQPGDMFVALPGVSSDGHKFIPAAIEKGASCVVGTMDLRLRVPFIKVDNSRRAMAYLCAALEGWPAQLADRDRRDRHRRENDHLLADPPHPAAGRAESGHDLHGQRGDRRRGSGYGFPRDHAGFPRSAALPAPHGGCRADARGTGSHLARAGAGAGDGCEFDIGVVTNITHEHLDYHGSYEEYRAAKGRLLNSLRKPAKSAG